MEKMSKMGTLLAFVSMAINAIIFMGCTWSLFRLLQLGYGGNGMHILALGIIASAVAIVTTIYASAHNR